MTEQEKQELILAERTRVFDACMSAIVPTMKGYLRTSRSGGMPTKLSDQIMAAVENAHELGYFKVVAAENLLTDDQRKFVRDDYLKSMEELVRNICK